MRAKFMLLVGVLGLAIVRLSLNAVADAGPEPKDKPEPAKKTAAENQKPVPISKDSIYTTSGEKGFKERVFDAYVLDKDGKLKPQFPYSHDLKAIFKQSEAMGASNIFIVRGNDIKQAIHGTRAIVASLDSADVPPDYDLEGKKIESEKFWLVVYLGSGCSGPPKWQSKSVTFKGQAVEFEYSRPRASTTTAISIPYFYWIPLPALKKGTHELRLIDNDKGHATLIRYVDVP